MTASDPRAAIEAVWRIESARIIAHLARLLRGDVGLAEEIAQDAFVAALQQWPGEGVPDNPGAWLMAAAKHRAIDRVRRDKVARRTREQLAQEAEAGGSTRGGAKAGGGDAQETVDASIDNQQWESAGDSDDLLRLIFMTCHPVLSAEARVGLTLRLLGGLATDEIARAFLVPEPTIAQRIVRAKRTLAEEEVPFEVPRGTELSERLASVLEVIYLVFNEGYTATAGEDWMRPALCEDALRLGRILAELSPDEPEVHGLVALMEIQASRARARVGPGGEPILLMDQNRALWDQLLIRRGLAALGRAEELVRETEGDHDRGLGPYALQAAIAACHARARRPDETDWDRIASLYASLAAIRPSPVVELNRAVAVGMAQGPAAGLAIVDGLMSEPSLADYHLLPCVRADFLRKLGRLDEARRELERAASLTRNGRERALLLERARECAPGQPSRP